MRNVFVATGVVAAVGWGLMLRPWDSNQPVIGAESSEQDQQPLNLEGMAEQAFFRGEYERAIELYRTVVHERPDDAQAWARFAHAMHELGRYEPALELHEKASSFDRNRIISSFRLGCALARLGRTDEAIAKLERAVEVGFRDRSRAEREPDLESLRDEPRFHRVLDRMAPPPEGEGAIDFWHGNWVLRNSKSGEPIGHWNLSRVERGHLFMEHWQLYNGETGRGMLHLDPTDGLWRLLRVDNEGQIRRLEGSAEDGVLTLSGSLIRPTGQSSMLEVVVSSVSERGVLQTTRISDDGGASWAPFEEIKMDRDEPMWGGRGGLR